MAKVHFEYFLPETLPEAMGLLQKYGDDARIMAGGTDLLLRLRRGAIQAKAVVGLKRIQELNAIAFHRKKGLTIGATALLADVAGHPDVQKYYPGIVAAIQETANVQIRNMGTLIGNLCNASPSADNAPMLLVLEGVLNIVGPGGKRSLPLNEFFKGPGMTALGKHEIVVSLDAPIPEAHTGTAYLSLSARGQVDCSAVGVGVKLTLEGNRCKDVRIAVGACAPVPMRVPEAEKCLSGKTLSEAQMKKAAKITAEAMRPINDLRASAAYRSTMVEVLVKRALTEARKNVK
jgi:carbon-monoxide dehydrogenase medium subunit